MPKPSVWIIDPPPEFAPRDEWEAFLDDALDLRRTHRTRAFDNAIEAARCVIAHGASPAADPERAARYREQLLAELRPPRSRKR